MARLLDDGAAIASALMAVGELLAADGEHYAIVVIGGAALSLQGIVGRPTRDVDILAWGVGGGEIARPPKPLPVPLERAISVVADRFGLPEGWLNTGPVSQWDTGLPPGLSGRIHWRDYAALRVGLIDRYDLIFFKVYAAADSNSPRTRHYQDLLALKPTHQELAAAVAWVSSQDPSPGFASTVDVMMGHLSNDLPSSNA